MSKEALSIEGNDPRIANETIISATHTLPPSLVNTKHDPSITFEEYFYYATITRAEEKADNEKHVIASGPKTLKSVLASRFSKGNREVVIGNETGEEVKEGEKRNLGNVSDKEWKNASRALRTAGWSSIFYLITTDILGPFSVP